MVDASRGGVREVPVWAALGAPLVGVPIMVALLALAAPDRTQASVAGDGVAHSEPVVEVCLAEDDAPCPLDIEATYES
jgi:hypothetical protein